MLTLHLSYDPHSQRFAIWTEHREAAAPFIILDLTSARVQQLLAPHLDTPGVQIEATAQAKLALAWEGK